MKVKPDPMYEPRNPFQVFMLCLAIMSGISIALSGVPDTAGSVDRFLDGWAEQTWGWLLAGGALTTLLGMYWQGHEADALFLKRIGLTIIAVPAYIYSIAIFALFQLEGLSLSLTMFGLATASAIQALRVNRFIKHAIYVKEAMEDGPEGV